MDCKVILFGKIKFYFFANKYKVKFEFFLRLFAKISDCETQ